MDAGHIPEKWLMAARSNEGPDNTVTDWFVRVLNCPELEIDSDGAVWCGNGWLAQDDIDAAIRRIDRGV